MLLQSFGWDLNKAFLPQLFISPHIVVSVQEQYELVLTFAPHFFGTAFFPAP